MFISEAATLAPTQDPTGKVWGITIIEGDRQGSSAYYPAKALQESLGLFKQGTKIYLNHPSVSEMEDRPVRDVKDVIGVLSEDATFDGKDINGKAHIFESHREWVKERAEAGVIGMSIRATADLEEAKRNGKPVLKRLNHVYSVDVVTEAGAGGAFSQVLESEGGSTNQKETEMELPKEFMEALDKGFNGIIAAVQESAAKSDAVLAKLEEAAQKPAEKPAEVNESKKVSVKDILAKVEEAELSVKGRDLILEASEKEGFDLEEAVAAQKAIEDEVRESIKGEFKGHEINESKAGEGFNFAGMFGAPKK